MPLRQDLVGDDEVLDTQMADGGLSKSVTRSEIERDRQRSRLSQR